MCTVLQCVAPPAVGGRKGSVSGVLEQCVLPVMVESPYSFIVTLVDCEVVGGY